MNVIKGCPKMPVGSHSPLNGAKEHFSAARPVFAIPRIGSATVKLAQFVKQCLYIRRFNQRMIMIGQNAPRECLAGLTLQQREQITRKCLHAFQSCAYQMAMLETGCGDQKAQTAKVGTMWRRMPRIPTLLAPSQQLLTLLGRELTPKISRPGHGWRLKGWRLKEPHKCGTPNLRCLPSSSSKFRPVRSSAFRRSVNSRHLTAQTRNSKLMPPEGGTPSSLPACHSVQAFSSSGYAILRTVARGF